MEKVIVFTKVFRYEPLIKACIRSVLAQTYKDFVYYLWVSDETLPVVKRFAEADDRIKIIQRNEWNEKASYYELFRDMIGWEKAKYLCEVDADDLLHKEFIEKMKCFLEANNLDMALCNRGYFTKDGIIKNDDFLPTVISDRKTLGDSFSDLYLGLRTVWATLFTTDSIMQADYSYMPKEIEKRMYGGDTMLMLTTLRACDRVGFLEEKLYYYNLDGGISKKYFEGRMDSDVFLYHFAVQFLKDMNAISEKNVLFLNIVLVHAIRDTVNLIAASGFDNEKKIKDIVYLCNQIEVKNAFYMYLYVWQGPKTMPIQWLFQNGIVGENISESEYKCLIEMFKIGCPKFKKIVLEDCFHELIYNTKILTELSKGTLKDSLIYLLSSLDEMSEGQREEALCLAGRINPVEYLKKYMNNNAFVIDAKEILCDILGNSTKDIYGMIIAKMEEVAEFYETYLLLYKEYAASMEDENNFFNAWLLQCEYYLENGEFETAEKEFSEIKELGIVSEWLNELECKLKYIRKG